MAQPRPFVGLFGTVWGIYHALMALGEGGSARIEQVAGPIGEALIMTALGLAVAIPAVLGYNALVRGNKAGAASLNRFAHDLHAYFVTGARVEASRGAGSSGLRNHDGFWQNGRRRRRELLGEINMVPLIDVMLVLLIVFIVTLPVINHAVKGRAAQRQRPNGGAWRHG